MRFIHAADVHLDSPLHGLAAYEGAPLDVLRGATRRALENLVQLAIRSRVDFVLIAGDLYDGDWLDYKTGRFFIQQVRRLQEVGIPVILLQGNHDAESRITSHLTLPENVYILPTATATTLTFEFAGQRVAIHGQGFAHQAEKRNLIVDYPAALPGHFNLGMAHTALEGREGHEAYCPCALADLLALGYDYWALGHVHQRDSVNGDEHPRVEFPGNVQGRHIRESGAKGCLLVTVDARGHARPEFQALDVLRWEVIDVDATELESPQDAADVARDALFAAAATAEDRVLAARLRLQCADSLRQRIAGELRHFREELIARLDERIWLEKIVLPQAVQQSNSAPPAIADDALAELQSILTEWKGDPESLQLNLTLGECGKLIRALPSDVKSVLVDDGEDVLSRAAGLLLGDREVSEP